MRLNKTHYITALYRVGFDKIDDDTIRENKKTKSCGHDTAKRNTKHKNKKSKIFGFEKVSFSQL